jgi:two-component system, OmpR family, KDP operon response regulator KdpE
MSDKDFILIVEDDAEIRQFLQSSLHLNGYASICVSQLKDAKQHFSQSKPILTILDLNLPDGDGAEFIKSIRSYSDLPIIVLSAKHSEQEKVRCFDLGADDYISKPFGIQELLARIRVSLNRISKMTLRDDVYHVGALEIDMSNKLVKLSDKPLHLTPTEFKLLFQLVQKPGKAFTHRQLLSSVWGSEYVDEIHYLRIHMGRLRARVEENPAIPRYILTEAGIGYRLAAN